MSYGVSPIAALLSCASLAVSSPVSSQEGAVTSVPRPQTAVSMRQGSGNEPGHIVAGEPKQADTTSDGTFDPSGAKPLIPGASPGTTTDNRYQTVTAIADAFELSSEERKRSTQTPKSTRALDPTGAKRLIPGTSAGTTTDNRYQTAKSIADTVTGVSQGVTDADLDAALIDIRAAAAVKAGRSKSMPRVSNLDALANSYATESAAAGRSAMSQVVHSNVDRAANASRSLPASSEAAQKGQRQDPRKDATLTLVCKGPSEVPGGPMRDCHWQ